MRKDTVDRYFGGRKIVPFEGGIDVELKTEEIFVQKDYDVWVAAIPTEPASKSKVEGIGVFGEQLKNEVCRRIVELRVEEMTMKDCMLFLLELRKLIAEDKCSTVVPAKNRNASEDLNRSVECLNTEAQPTAVVQMNIPF